MDIYYYDQVIPIHTCPCTAWIIEDDTEGTTSLDLWDPKSKIEDVINSYKVHHPKSKFKVRRVDVGEFLISKVDHSYSGDGRTVNQNLEVGI